MTGRLSSVVSGSAEAFEKVRPMIETYAASGVSYVGEGELARICKIAHNVLLGATLANLIEVTLMAQKAGVPRHAFLKFINSSVMGSVFSRYKSPALVNLDWTTTLTPDLMLKDLDLGLESARKFAVAAPITAAVREVFQAHISASGVTPWRGEARKVRLRRAVRDLGAGRGRYSRSRRTSLCRADLRTPAERSLTANKRPPVARGAPPRNGQPSPAKGRYRRRAVRASRRTSRSRAWPRSPPSKRPNTASCATCAAGRAASSARLAPR